MTTPSERLLIDLGLHLSSLALMPMPTPGPRRPLVVLALATFSTEVEVGVDSSKALTSLSHSLGLLVAEDKLDLASRRG